MRRFLLACLLLPLAAVAQDGALDPTFGDGGRVETNVGNADVLTSLALGADGTIVAAGYTRAPNDDEHIVVVRYLQDGSLDPSFGTGGIAQIDLTSTFRQRVYSVHVTPDGHVLLAGYGLEDLRHFTVARLSPSGVLDETFGEGGIVRTDWEGFTATAFDVVELDDGRIVAVGRVDTAANTTWNDDFAITRFLPDGQPDPTFGGEGRVSTDFGYRDTALCVEAGLGGYLYVVGYAQEDDVARASLARYLPSGELDPTFGEQGRVDFGGIFSIGLEVLLLDDGLLLVYEGNYLWRFLSNGQPDLGFGFNGVVEIAGAASFGSPSAVLDEADRILIPALPGLGVRRVNTDGTPDTSFGNEGIVMAFPEGSALPRALVVQPEDGSVIVGGYGPGASGTTDFKLARILTEPISTAADAAPLPSDLRLDAFPNPTTSSTSFTFDLPTPADVTLRIYDLLGREAAVLVEGERAAGTHRVTWGSEGVPNGLYVARLEAGGEVHTRRLVITR